MNIRILFYNTAHPCTLMKYPISVQIQDGTTIFRAHRPASEIGEKRDPRPRIAAHRRQCWRRGLLSFAYCVTSTSTKATILSSILRMGRSSGDKVHHVERQNAQRHEEPSGSIEIHHDFPLRSPAWFPRLGGCNLHQSEHGSWEPWKGGTGCNDGGCICKCGRGAFLAWRGFRHSESLSNGGNVAQAIDQREKPYKTPGWCWIAETISWVLPTWRARRREIIPPDSNMGIYLPLRRIAILVSNVDFPRNRLGETGKANFLDARWTLFYHRRRFKASLRALWCLGATVSVAGRDGLHYKRDHKTFATASWAWKCLQVYQPSAGG